MKYKLELEENMGSPPDETSKKLLKFTNSCGFLIGKKHDIKKILLNIYENNHLFIKQIRI